MEAKKQKCPKCKTIRYETDFEIKRLDMHYKTCKVCRSYKKKKDEPVVNENKQKCSNCKVVKDIIMFQGIDKQVRKTCQNYRNSAIKSAKKIYEKHKETINQKKKEKYLTDKTERLHIFRNREDLFETNKEEYLIQCKVWLFEDLLKLKCYYEKAIKKEIVKDVMKKAEFYSVVRYNNILTLLFKYCEDLVENETECKCGRTYPNIYKVIHKQNKHK